MNGHLMAQDGVLYCVPQIVHSMTNDPSVTWEDYKLVRGDNIFTWLKWFFTDGRVSYYEKELCMHLELKRNKICHIWHSTKYIYHGS